MRTKGRSWAPIRLEPMIRSNRSANRAARSMKTGSTDKSMSLGDDQRLPGQADPLGKGGARPFFGQVEEGQPVVFGGQAGADLGRGVGRSVGANDHLEGPAQVAEAAAEAGQVGLHYGRFVINRDKDGHPGHARKLHHSLIRPGRPVRARLDQLAAA